MVVLFTQALEGKKKLHMKHKCFGTWSRWFNVVLLLITIFVYQFTTGNFGERKKKGKKRSRLPEEQALGDHRSCGAYSAGT